MKVQRLLVGVLIALTLLVVVVRFAAIPHNGGTVTEAEINAEVKQLIETEVKAAADKLYAELTDEKGSELCNKIKAVPAALTKLEGDYVAAKKAGDDSKRQEIAEQYAKTIEETLEAQVELLNKIDDAAHAINMTLAMIAREAPGALDANRKSVQEVAKPVAEVMKELGTTFALIRGPLQSATTSIKAKAGLGEKITKEVKSAALVKAADNYLNSKTK